MARSARPVAAGLALVLIAGLAVLTGHRLGGGATPAALTAAAVPTVTVPPPTTTTTSAPTTTAPPPAPPPTHPQVARPVPVSAVDVFRGLGVWVDAYDWTMQFTKGKPGVVPSDVDRMAARGAQTLYIQAAKQDAPGDVLEPALLAQFITRAHKHGMRVVAWYLPTLVDTGQDLARLVAIGNLNVEGIGVDIESRDVSDPATRSARLADLSTTLRAALPGRAMAAVVMPPVATDVINPAFWPGFPWHALAPLYDVWMPMDYWTLRTADSPYRDAGRYTAENIDRLRADLGLPDAPVHPIGGIGDGTSLADLQAYVAAALARGVIGGGIYDYRTTADALWPVLELLRH